MALNHMLCDVGRGGGGRTCMASSVWVRVVQQGAAGLARRLAMGEPLGAIWGGGEELVRAGPCFGWGRWSGGCLHVLRLCHGACGRRGPCDLCPIVTRKSRCDS